MKSITKPIELEHILHLLTSFFAQANAVARQTRFVQRTSTLSGQVFLQALVIGFLKSPHASLNQLARECAHLGSSISPQGLHERINARALAFVKAMYQLAFEHFRSQLALPLVLVRQFSQILLLDSTFEALPDSLQTEYPGCGVEGARASLKVQLVFDFVCGQLIQLTVQAGRMADQAFTQYLEVVQAGALVIMDLGYFRLASLHAIAQRSAYFLLRYHYPTTVMDEAGVRLDLFPWLSTQPTPVDCPILLGASCTPPLACRLIAVPVPGAVAEERRRRAHQNAARHHRTPTQAYLQALEWTVFLTNVPVALLSTSQVLAFYRIRWQIELIFKFWKSHCGLDYLPGVREVRVLTEFYAKLLVAVLSNFFIAPVRLPAETDPTHEISGYQVRQILADFARDLFGKLADPLALRRTLEAINQQIARYGFKQIRRKKPNVMAMLAGLSALDPPP